MGGAQSKERTQIDQMWQSAWNYQAGNSCDKDTKDSNGKSSLYARTNR